MVTTKVYALQADLRQLQNEYKGYDVFGTWFNNGADINSYDDENFIDDMYDLADRYGWYDEVCQWNGDAALIAQMVEDETFFE